MADEEFAYSVTKQFHTIRGKSLTDFQNNVEALLGQGAFQAIAASYAAAFEVQPTFTQATQNLQSGGLVDSGQNSSPSTAGSGGNGQYGTVPQPGFNQQQQSSGPDVPPGVEYPGDCAHGHRVFGPKTAKVGARWECSIPWSKNAASGRCNTEWVNGR